MTTLYRNVDDTYFRPFCENPVGYLTHDSISCQANIFDFQAKLIGETNPKKIEKYARDIVNLARTVKRANKHEENIAIVSHLIITNVPKDGVISPVDLESYIFENYTELCERKNHNDCVHVCRPKGLVAVVLNRLTNDGYLERKMSKWGRTAYIRTNK